jgi:glutamate 5-kinase
MSKVARPPVAAARRIVLKLGTRVVAYEDGRLALPRIFSVIDTAVRLREEGRDVLIVSSGAVGLGMDALGFNEVPNDLEERQACAAVGQTRLMGLYSEGFQRMGHRSGQVLLTRGDFEDRVRYLNLRSTLTTLLGHGVIPIINENDAVSTEELAYVEGERQPLFGDNDSLSAQVAAKLEADLLVLLTDVEGVFDRDPREERDARLLERIEPGDREASEVGGSGSAVGRGGMRSKFEAASRVARGGCHAVIASGLAPEHLPRLFAGESVGTWFPASGALQGWQRWIAFAATPRGALVLDEGAVHALRERGASLLAAGVDEVDGDFEQGDVVDLLSMSGEAVGKGIVYCDAETARRWCGGTPPEGIRNHEALVHRDHLVLEA